jgi:hypothetical protein
MEGKNKTMEGIVGGVPKASKKPVVDGIVTGIAKRSHVSCQVPTESVKPSATQVSAGVFGAGASPQGQGDGKSGSKKSKL